MKFTQEDTERKIKTLVESNSLVLRAAACIIPIPVLFDRKDRMWLTITQLSRRSLITSEKARGMKNSLPGASLETLWKWEQKWGTEGYCTLLEIKHREKMLQESEKQMGFLEKDLSTLFMQHMKYANDYSLFAMKVKSFFKYMPFLNSIYSRHLEGEPEIMDGTYCCEDCDGPISYWKHLHIENATRDIAEKLKKIKITW